MRAARKCRILAIVLLIAGSCIPRRTFISPAFDVAVIDNSGNALPKLKVGWNVQDLSGGKDVGSSREAITDSEGRTHFEAVTHWISFAGEFFGCLSEALSRGVQAGCGSYVDVSVDTKNFIETARQEGAVNGRSTSPGNR